MKKIQELRKLNIKYDWNKEKAIQDLSAFIQCKSISYADQSKMDFNEFVKIHSFINDNYPFINQYGKKTVINQGSIYYTIPGTDSSLPALVLMGHLDVVPPIQENKWDYEPFSGFITQTDIYGRGAMDMKHIDCAVLNALENILAKHGQPKRTIYICFGHDEETLGLKGQWEIKNDLKKKNANIGMVLDEGGSISDGSIYHANANLLEIQVMEKGYLDVEIIGTSKGGHSSHPGSSTALSNVAKAITAIMDHPFTPTLNKPLIRLFENIKPYLVDLELANLMNNIELNKDNIASYLAKDSKLSPYVQTTIAPTMISSDSKGANVLPQEVKAIINLRLSDSDTIEQVKEHINQICKEIDVTINYKSCINASAISSIDSTEYQLLTNTIKDYFDFDCIVPSISVGGTDCCFYNELCNNCYRFTPILCDSKYYEGIHGINEHLNIDAYLYGINFYMDLILKYNY